jgi:hypothetical protein
MLRRWLKQEKNYFELYSGPYIIPDIDVTHVISFYLQMTQ